MRSVWKLGCAALVSSLALIACGDDETAADTGVRQDAGLADSGVRMDAGAAIGDAGLGDGGTRTDGGALGDAGLMDGGGLRDAGADGGITVRDGGTMIGDGGTTIGDGGTMLGDGGTMVGDAGTIAPDGGTTMSASYSGSVHPVLMMRCAPCHSPTGVASFTQFILVDDIPTDLTSTLMFVTPANPTASPLLTKASGQVSHGGGAVLPAGSPGYLLLEAWVTGGTAP